MQPYPQVICVDLDGTLVKTDTLVELFLRFLKESPHLIFHAFLWLITGKAKLKQELANRCSLSPSTLPFNHDLISYLKEQKANGRQIILATASDQKIACEVSEYLGWIDEIIASDGVVNLKGLNKAKALVKRFGEKGFTYAGNDRSDLKVWEVAGTGILVAPSSNLTKEISCSIETTIISEENPYFLFLKAIRTYQWAKNLLVFVPIIAAGKMADIYELGSGLPVFFCFCLVASGGYLLNDILDIEADRSHPRKRERPLAKGSIPLIWGFLWALGLIVIGLTFSILIKTSVFLILLTYFFLSVSYSTFLKTKSMVDVYTLAALYVIRIYGGGVSEDIYPSIWLLSFSGFLFLGLAFLKRENELVRIGGNEKSRNIRRGYHGDDKEAIKAMGIASSFSSAIVLSLYIDSNAANALYEIPVLLWSVVPLYLFWICRVWLFASRGEVNDDPIVFASKDWVSWVVFSICGAFYLLALWGSSMEFLFFEK